MDKNPIRKVIIDADGCPRGARDIVLRLQGELGYEAHTVSSFHHEISSPNRHTVGDDPDEADFAVANRVAPNDIVVTQDLGLAAMALSKGGVPITPNGMCVTSDILPALLEERYLGQKHRRGGGRTKGPKARRASDDERFERAFRSLF